MEEENSKVHILVEHIKEYAETRADILKLEAADRFSSAASSIASIIIFMVTGTLFLVFASAGLAWLVAHATGSAAIGFFAVAGFYLLVGIIVYAGREKWIKTPVVNTLLKQLSDDK